MKQDKKIHSKNLKEYEKYMKYSNPIKKEKYTGDNYKNKIEKFKLKKKAQNDLTYRAELKHL